MLKQIIGGGTGLPNFPLKPGDKILKIPQPTNKKNQHYFSYFLSEAIMYRQEIDISEDLSQGGRRGLI